MRANRAAFDRWRIVPRMLRDVSERDTSVELFGRTLPTPFLLAPIGVLEMAHREADRAVARAARRGAADGPLEPGVDRRWRRCREIARRRAALVPALLEHVATTSWRASSRRAEACGCEAIVVTLDTTILGWRTRDLDLAYLPFLRGKGIAQYTSDPVFRRLLAEPTGDARQPEPQAEPARAPHADPAGAELPGPLPRGAALGPRARGGPALRRRSTRGPSLTWDDLPFLRERTKLPILLKGILHPDDARRAVDDGIDGIVVSNHGGRQVDGAIATLDALPGDRRGGGRARPGPARQRHPRRAPTRSRRSRSAPRPVLLGRPYVYGLALAGEAGVARCSTNFLADFDLTMGLAGCRSVGGDRPRGARAGPLTSAIRLRDAGLGQAAFAGRPGARRASRGAGAT